MVRSKFKICSLKEKLGHWFESKFWSQSLKFVRCWQIPHWDTSLLMKSLLCVTFYFLEINVFLRFFRPLKSENKKWLLTFFSPESVVSYCPSSTYDQNDYKGHNPYKVSCFSHINSFVPQLNERRVKKRQECFFEWEIALRTEDYC